mgnify:CR=1 FL=1
MYISFGNLRPLANPEILKIQILLNFKNWTLLNFKIFQKMGSVFKIISKLYPTPGRGSALGRRRRQRHGYSSKFLKNIRTHTAPMF